MDKKIWFITGVSSGLGKALAEAVISSGDFVIGTFRKLSEVQSFSNQNEGKAKGVLLDVTDMDEIEKVITSVIKEYGSIDVLVNNAGIGIIGAVEEASLAEVRKIFEANFFGTLKLTQAVLPHMRARREGSIVQISSHAGVKAFAGFGIYNASKFALEGYSEALSQEVGPLGINITIVEPGPFRTNFAGRSLLQSEKVIDDYTETAGAFRDKLLTVHNRQEGDPEKAALAVIAHLRSNNPTLRLPLGSVPLKTIQMKIDSLSADLEANKEVAANTVFLE